MQLNSDVPPIIGRTHELQSLLERLAHRHVNTVVVGPPGSGKSTLLRAYAQQFGDRHSPLVFVNGRDLTEDSDPQSIIDKTVHVDGTRSNDPAIRPLVVIDGLDESHPASPALALVTSMRSVDAQFLISTRPYSHQIFNSVQAGNDFELISLSEHTRDDISLFLQQSSVAYSPEQLQRLVSVSNGSPLIASLVASQLRLGTLTWNQLETAFAEFEYPGILLPDGRPSSLLHNESRVFVSDVASTNENIWRELQRHPERLRELPSRKFEEIVATMLEKQGYEVQLTPASKDGGFDIYVASKQALGSFLYLVECKRYTPPNKVGVHLVRALHGVVQKTRANAGMLVTTSFFTHGAQQYADETTYTLHLHDFLALKKWLHLL